jgi:hypothetical protein
MREELHHLLIMRMTVFEYNGMMKAESEKVALNADQQNDLNNSVRDLSR